MAPTHSTSWTLIAIAGTVADLAATALQNFGADDLSPGKQAKLLDCVRDALMSGGGSGGGGVSALALQGLQGFIDSNGWASAASPFS